jgi:predicted MFS family arabinose efflux permease
MEKHREHFERRAVEYIHAISFCYGFLDAFLIYLLSSYFSKVIGSDNVGIFYVATYAVVFAFLYTIHSHLRKLGTVRALLLLLLVALLASVLLTKIPIGWFGAGVLVILFIATNVGWVVLDIILEGFSSDNVTGRVRGLHLTIVNAGFLIAPFLSISVLERYGFDAVFFLLAVGYAMLIAASMFALRYANRYSDGEIRMKATFRKMFREPNLFRIYHISFAMEFFYAIGIVYTPLYLTSLGIGWGDISLIFTVMLLPFVLFQYPLGVLADKRYGEKEFLTVGILIAAAATLGIGLFSTPSVLFWMVLLFLTRVGIAAIEVLRDSYFYKQVDGREMDIIAFFRTTRPIANISGAIIASLFLTIFPVPALFILAAVILFSAAVSAMRLTDTKSEYERRREMTYK